LSSEPDLSSLLSARLDAHEHLLKHLIVTVLAQTPEPIDSFENLQRRLAGSLRHRPAEDGEVPGTDRSRALARELVDRIAGGVRDEIDRALGQIAKPKK
jgi:hypothetical protein